MITLTTDELLTAPLRAGDECLISGTFFTARDAAHARLLRDLEQGRLLPFSPEDGPLYYVGPTPAKGSHALGSCGPTSSYRMDAPAIVLMDHGFRCSLGKGPRGEEFKRALRSRHGRYFTVVGGIAALLSSCVLRSEIILYPELGTEAIRQLTVKDFPAILAYDEENGDVFRDGILDALNEKVSR